MVQLPDESKTQFKLSSKLMMGCLALIGTGVVLTILSYAFGSHLPNLVQEDGHGGHQRFWMSINVALQLALPLGLGGLYFVAFNHASGAAWSVIIRRIAENKVWFLLFVLVLMAVMLFFGKGDIYAHWMHPVFGSDPLIDLKRAYLFPESVPDSKSATPPDHAFPGFFVFRNLIMVGIWILLGLTLMKISVAQDKDGESTKTKKMASISAIALVFFGISYSVSSWDLTMSVEPHWFSTMWAVYTFAGLALTTFASLVLWVWYLKRQGYYGDAINANHWHDLGKFMWGHTIFWAYIGISQFLLIWYAHIPEETVFYHHRMYNADMTYNAWAVVSLVLYVIRFIIPFLLIIRRDAKRNLNLLAGVAVLVLVGQVWDFYWALYPSIITPEYSVGGNTFIMFSWQEIGPILLVIGSYILITAWGLSRNSLIPKNDPRLEESLHWHQ